MTPPTPAELLLLLEEYLPLYRQMTDPTSEGRADEEMLDIFSAFLSLSVISARPLLLSAAKVPDALGGMRWLLKLVVRRMVVGNLGTGNVERQFSEAARRVNESANFSPAEQYLAPLNPLRQEFIDQLSRRSFNISTLAFLRRSIVQKSISPKPNGFLHLIMRRQDEAIAGASDKDATSWASTIGNTLLTKDGRRPRTNGGWPELRNEFLAASHPGEIIDALKTSSAWSGVTISQAGKALAEAAANVWY
jgi:hypothetical protein